MKKFLMLFVLLIIYGCNKPKAIFICGDHECINKQEAKVFFEENLSIEVKILDKNKKKEIDLVELNLKQNEFEKKISLKKKESTNNTVKLLTNNEIKKIKSELKNKKKKEKQVKLKVSSNENESFINKKIKNDKKTKNIFIEKNDKQIADVCAILEKCSINEISKYLIEQGKKKDFPNISIRN